MAKLRDTNPYLSCLNKEELEEVCAANAASSSGVEGYKSSYVPNALLLSGIRRKWAVVEARAERAIDNNLPAELDLPEKLFYYDDRGD